MSVCRIGIDFRRLAVIEISYFFFFFTSAETFVKGAGRNSGTIFASDRY